MDKYESQVKGNPIVYTNDGIQFGSNKLLFDDMSEITLKGGDSPAWTFVFRGKRLQVPYSPSEKEFVEPFIKRAMQKLSLDDLADLIQEPKEKPVAEVAVGEKTAAEKPVVKQNDTHSNAMGSVQETPETVTQEPAAKKDKKADKKAKKEKKKEEKKKKTKVCKHCGAEIAKSAKKCPHCGGKNKKPIYKRISLYIILAAILVVILIIAGSGNQYKLSDDASNMPADQYKAACSEITYEELSRNADKHQGEKLKFTGEVQQVAVDMENGESEYLVAVTKDEYDFYDDNIYLYYEVGDNDKIIEDDIITIYGEASGEETYTSVLGESITIPAVTAVYVDIEK